MRSFAWNRAAALLVLAAVTTWACSDSNTDEPSGTAGKNAGGGTAGAGAEAGSSSAGEGGGGPDPCLAEPESEACREVPWCGPFQITEVCGPIPFELCPTSLANFIERTPCDTVLGMNVFDTSCGGKVLVRERSDFTESWEFDADDKLVSVRREGDALHVCFEGGRSRSWLYGAEPCEPDAATKVDVCASQGGAGTGGAGSVDAGGAGGAPASAVGGAGGAG